MSVFNVGDKICTRKQENSSQSFESSFVGVVVAAPGAGEVWVQITPSSPQFESSLTLLPNGDPKYVWISLYTNPEQTNQATFPSLWYSEGLELAV